MDIVSVGVILVLLVLAIVVIVRPLFSTGPDAQSDQSIEIIKARYETALTGLHDLESELQENKIEPETYTSRKDDLINQAAALLKQIKDHESGKAGSQE